MLSALVGWSLGGLFLRPLRFIERTARRISISNLRERIPMGHEKDEVARLCVLLNEMFDRLEKSFDQIKQFTADLSHELRTPLSIIALHTEKLLNRLPEDGETRAELQEVLDETKRLNQIIDQILVLAKAEAQSLPLKIQSHQTDRFIQEFAEDAAALAENAGKQFVLGKNDRLEARFDASWLRQVLFNLLSNSLKFADSGSPIHLGSFQSALRWCLTMTDTGPGIPAELRESVFERFKQLPQRSGVAQGTGLGLAVCKSIVELHGGHIYLESGEQPGLRVRIELPLEPQMQHP
jgi:signal transduction histidine kinase